MKRIFLILICAVLCSVSVFAENYYYDEVNGQIIWLCQEDNGEYTLLCPGWCRDNLSDYENIMNQYGYSASTYHYTGDFVIPDYINAIGERAFSVIVPYLDSYQFHDNEDLTSVTIPNSVRSIGSTAFHGCIGLTSVTIPNSVTEIGWYAFSNCSGLTSITIPNSVTEINGYTFENCSGLTSVTIGTGVTNIESYAFENCSGLVTVNLNATNWTTDNGCFHIWDGCSSFTTLNIGNNVTNIPACAFENCSGLTSVSIPNSVTSIGYRAFDGCNGLRTVTIGTGVANIGINAFYGCSNLTTVNFNAANCTTMGSSSSPVFEDCGTSLVTLNIGEGVTIIPDNAFKKCKSFTSITSAANNPPVIYTSSFDSGLSPMTPVIVPCGTVSDYERYWYIFRNIQQSADCGSTGIDDDYANKIAIFPNPVTDILNITSSETISEIKIVNTLGQVVKRIEVNSDNAVCNVEELPNGFYVVRIYNEDTKSFCQKKFAKE